MPERTGWGAGTALSDTHVLSPADEDARRRAARTVAVRAADLDEARLLLEMLGLDTLPPRQGRDG